ncbi:MAG: GNAT family N-acetyltransferase [Chloroflexota bacterium]|nr:GNAT family N-acetyltransferase [Chloroflexota bacterium]
MTDNIGIRHMRPNDSQALMALEDETADGGMVSFLTRYKYDYYPVQQALRPNLVGLVAESSASAGLVGVGMMSFGECQFDGEVRPYGYLGGLGVHQDFRRRGIATAIVAELLAIAEERFGPDRVIFARIQAGNEASLRANMKWANQLIRDRERFAISKMLDRLPKGVDGISVRLAGENEYKTIAHLQNAFYRKANLYPPKTSQQLREWVAKRPFGEEINRYYVAVDQREQNEQIVAGVGVTLEGCLMTTHVVRMPWLMKAANAIFRRLPAGNETKRMNGHWLWYKEGYEEACDYLWTSVKWLERKQANLAWCSFDSEGPLGEAISLPRFPPTTGGYIVINSSPALRDDCVLYFNTMMT